MRPYPSHRLLVLLLVLSGLIGCTDVAYNTTRTVSSDAPGPAPAANASDAPSACDPSTCPIPGPACDDASCAPIAPPEGFARVLPSAFVMGSPDDEPYREEGSLSGRETAHPVTLTHAFAIQHNEVTQGQWRALMGNNPSHFQSCGDACPVEQVTWFDALAYANALSQRDGLTPCYTLSECDDVGPGEELVCGRVEVNTASGDPQDCAGYRLPTEAEWEFAARAGSDDAFWSGPISRSDTLCYDDPSLDGVARYCARNSYGTRPTDERRANPLGLRDVHGNVQEWTADAFVEDLGADAQTDPFVWAEDASQPRVMRGGGWTATASACRSAARLTYPPEHSDRQTGFRLAITLP